MVRKPDRLTHAETCSSPSPTSNTRLVEKPKPERNPARTRTSAVTNTLALGISPLQIIEHVDQHRYSISPHPDSAHTNRQLLAARLQPHHYHP
jgi:hypothetical protein